MWIAYESVQIKSQDADLMLESPFFQAVIEVDQEHSTQVKKLSSKWPNIPQDCQSLIDELKIFPIAYKSPRPLEEISANANESKESCEFPKTFSEFVAHQSLISMKDFSWNVEEILEKSKVEENIFDPKTLYGILREKRLLEDAKSSSSERFNDDLLKMRLSNEARFFDLMKLTLRQTHFVTSQAVNVLGESATQFNEAFVEIMAFREDERHHDKLIEDSLNHLDPTGSWRDLPVLPATRLSLELLIKSAKVGGAFCSVVESFEGNAFAEVDPIAEALSLSSRPLAARGVRKHFYINKEHKHAYIGETFVEKAQTLNCEEAQFAIRITELVCRLGGELWCQIEKEFKETYANRL